MNKSEELKIWQNFVVMKVNVCNFNGQVWLLIQSASFRPQSLRWINTFYRPIKVVSRCNDPSSARESVHGKPFVIPWTPKRLTIRLTCWLVYLLNGSSLCVLLPIRWIGLTRSELLLYVHFVGDFGSIWVNMNPYPKGDIERRTQTCWMKSELEY